MEGQNKRTNVEIECCKCGDTFPVSPEFANSFELDSVRCQECEDECEDEVRFNR